MAETLLKQIRVDLKSKSGASNQYQLTLNVVQTGDDNIGSNTTPVRLELWLKSVGSYYSGISGINGTIRIWTNNSSFTPSGFVDVASAELSSIGNKASAQICSWSGDIPHNGDGSVVFRVQGSLSNSRSTSYTPANGTCDTDNFWLNTIPRYANITSFEVSKRDEYSVNVSFGTDATIDYCWYSKDNGANWSETGVSADSRNFVISNLSSGTWYDFKIRIRRQDSQLTTDSGTYGQQTYYIPHIIGHGDFTIGNNFSLQLYNPLRRNMEIFMYGKDGIQICHAFRNVDGWTEIGSTGEEQDTQYRSIPNDKSWSYNTRAICSEIGTDFWADDRGKGRYYVNENDCAPIPSITSVIDINDITKALTGNNNKIIKGYSTARVNFKSGNNSVRKHAGVKSVTINNVTKSGTDTTADFNNSGSQTYTVTVTDTRNISRSAPFTISNGNWIQYDELTLKPIVERNQPTDGRVNLSATGNYFNQNFGAVQNGLQVRYRFKKRSETDYSSWVNVSNPTKKDTTFEVAKYTIAGTFDYRDAFDFEVEAWDSLVTKSVVVVVSAGEPVFWWNKENLKVNNKLNVKKTINIESNETQGESGSINFRMGSNDYAKIYSYASGENNGILDIATFDDGNEGIYVTQFTGAPDTATLKRRAKLLNSVGDTELPGRAYCDGKAVIINEYNINFLSDAGSYMHVARFSGGAKGINWWDSDKRLKDNIKDTEEKGLDVINKIEHKSFEKYDYIDHKKKVGEYKIGYIANQLKEIDEDLVFGVEQENIDPILNINTSVLIPYMTKAIQEQQEIINGLKQEIEELKTIINK